MRSLNIHDKGISTRFTRAETYYDAEWVAKEYARDGGRLIRLLHWWTPNEFFIGPLTGQGAAGCSYYQRRNSNG